MTAPAKNARAAALRATTRAMPLPSQRASEGGQTLKTLSVWRAAITCLPGRGAVWLRAAAFLTIYAARWQATGLFSSPR